MIVNISNLNLKSLISSTYDFDISKPSKHLYGPILILAYKNSNTTTKNLSLQKVVQTVKYIVYIYMQVERNGLHEQVMDESQTKFLSEFSNVYWRVHVSKVHFRSNKIVTPFIENHMILQAFYL